MPLQSKDRVVVGGRAMAVTEAMPGTRELADLPHPVLHAVLDALLQMDGPGQVFRLTLVRICVV